MKNKINLWPIGIIATFVLFVGSLACVVVIASTHRDSLVSNNYYEEELKFQNQIDAAARAQKMGASVTQEMASGKVVIRLPVSQMKEELVGTIEFYRPSAAGMDHALKLAPTADGTQTINTANLASGPWTVRVNWTVAGQNYFIEQKLII